MPLTTGNAKVFRVYGQRSGDPKGTLENETRCVSEVFRGWHFGQCARKRGHGPLVDLGLVRMTEADEVEHPPSLRSHAVPVRVVPARAGRRALAGEHG